MKKKKTPKFKRLLLVVLGTLILLSVVCIIPLAVFFALDTLQITTIDFNLTTLIAFWILISVFRLYR